ncbi:helix-turn-helix transcriptional regulator [Streptoalloteichus hindustanus]|uniref:Regulatory protein, luxR family n=1 Tax=Streptoalloteichus hindustanus TaxID=2017 RepID=A0A1M5CTI9_STRHI|nr:helix-turn-helix transcriptional regulator [Streptoalloteichus hindustanus]SHF57652.1 regulatory protein, luxR family [Streptoalloteichus hindustanus]
MDSLRRAALGMGWRGRLLVVRGLPGSGRSEVLRAATAMWRAEGLRVAPAPVGRPSTQVVPRTVLVADDPAVPADALLACRQPGCLVVATCLDDDVELPEIADEVVDLPPLGDDDVVALLRNDAGLDEAAVDALRSALGSWFGNPGTVLALVGRLTEVGRLVPVRDRLCLAHLEVPIGLPPEHHLVRCAARVGDPARTVLEAAAVLGGVDLADLSVFAGGDLAAAGRAVDALVECGVLVADREGRLSCCCAALAATVVEQAGPDAARAVHWLVGRHLLDGLRRGLPVDRAALADHVAAAAPAVADGGALAGWLVEQVAEAERREPERAARWSASARRLGARTDLLPLVARTGQYDLLREVFDEEAAGADRARRWDLAAAGMLAELNGADPVPALADEPPSRLAAWWLGRLPSWTPLPPRADDVERLVSTAELTAIYHALRVEPRECAQALRAVRNGRAAERFDDLVEAGGGGDVATVLEIVLGQRYRSARNSPPRLYQEVVRGYAAADWTAALRAVRQLESHGAGTSPPHHMARLVAAAIHATRGEWRDAEAWLSKAGQDIRYSLVRSTVECAVLGRRGEHAAALDLAWSTLRLARTEGARWGRERLLLQALQIALRLGNRDMAEALMADAEDLYRRDGTRLTRQTVLLGRGLLHGDLASAAEGVDVVRQRGHRPDLLWACQILARFCDDSRNVIAELRSISHQGGTEFLLPARVNALLREFGVPAVRETGPTALSTMDRQIVELIREGQTNRQIASALRVSEKTVEHHLTRLFAWTGCRSRVELAAASLDGRIPGVRG